MAKGRCALLSTSGSEVLPRVTVSSEVQPWPRVSALDAADP